MNTFKILVCAMAMNLLWAFPIQAEGWSSVAALLDGARMVAADSLFGFGTP